MKKLVSVMVVVLMISAFSITAFAKEPKAVKQPKYNVEALTPQLEKLQAKADKAKQQREKYATKQDKWSDFQVFVNEKRTQMQDNTISMISLNKEIVSLKLQISNTLKTLKESGTTLSDEQQKGINALNSQVKETLDTAKKTNSDIKALLDSNKKNIKAKDFSATEAVFTQVYEIQKSRISQLTAAKGYLQQISDMLK